MLAQALVAAGFALMLYNLWRAFRFALAQRDVMVDKSSRTLSVVALGLIVMFTVTYAYIFILNLQEVSVGVILFSGSIFVTIMLLWIIQLVGSIRKNTREMAVTLTTVIEARDPDLKGHSRHVRNLTEALYQYLPDDMRRSVNLGSLEYAAIFHDLGKLGVPEAVLNKPGKLTPEEWEIMRQHPRIGAEILNPVKSFAEIEDWIRYHHERIDGKGYYGLAGEQIPLGARIIAVPDTFSAMYMRRPYKDFASYDECIGELRRVAGTQLDAQVVEAFCRIPRQTVLDCGRDLPSIDHE